MLQTKTAEEILSTVFKPKEFIIDGLLTQGLYVLAGAQKVRKSWMAMDICLSIATGVPVLGRGTIQGTALYLCLEDNYLRLQRRLFQMNAEPIENLHFALAADKIGAGLTKNGEKKGIRVDTLAKQFGEKFTKVNLEKKMGYYIPKPEVSESKAYQKRNKTKSKEKSNWEHFEQWTFKQKNYYPSVKGNIKRYSRTDYLIKSAQRSVFYSRNTFDFIIRAFLLILAGKNKKRKAVSYHKVGTLPINKSVRNVKCIGNINYKTLTQSSGDNFTVKVNIENILKIVNQPILYSARIKNDTVEITVKEKDKDFLSELLELDKIKHQLEIQNEKITNQKAYKDLKREADITGEKLQYIIITAEQLKILKDNYIKFAYFEKDDKYNIAFLPTQTEVIKKLIFSKSNSEENEAKRNNRIYSQLKAAAAQSGEKLKYKTKLSASQLSLLKNSKIKFAYFACKENKELFNIAFERKDEEKIKSIIPNETLKKS